MLNPQFIDSALLRLANAYIFNGEFYTLRLAERVIYRLDFGKRVGDFHLLRSLFS